MPPSVRWTLGLWGGNSQAQGAQQVAYTGSKNPQLAVGPDTMIFGYLEPLGSKRRWLAVDPRVRWKFTLQRVTVNSDAVEWVSLSCSCVLLFVDSCRLIVLAGDCCLNKVPRKPVADCYGLLSMNSGLLWCIVAYYFRLLDVPGSWLTCRGCWLY